MGLLRWYRRLTMARGKSLECLVWISSAFIVTFVLLSMGKLHNEFGREQASSLKMHPEGRRVLSLQNASKDKVPVRVKRQQLNEDSKLYLDGDFSDVQKLDKSDNHVSDHETDRNPDKTQMGYADTVAIEDNTDDLYNFEELDGFNYVVNKEKREADLKLSNNIRVAGGEVIVDKNSQDNRFVQRDNVDPNLIDAKESKSWQQNLHPAKRDTGVGNKWQESVPFDFHQDDDQDLPLHEQQLLDHKIVQHKPIKPNLPPEDEHYDSHLGNSQPTVQPQQYFYQKDNGPVKSGAPVRSFGSQVQFYDPNLEGFRDKETKAINEVKYASFNNGAANIAQDSQKHIPQSFQNVGLDNNSKRDRYILRGKTVLKNSFSQNAAQPHLPNDDGHSIGNQIQQQSQFQQPHKNEYSEQKPKKRKKKKRRGSKRNDNSSNNTVVFESQRQGHLDLNNNEHSAFQKKPKSSVSNLYMKPNGRLGNQMFEVASLYGIARRTGRKPYMSKYSDIYQYFSRANRTVAMGEAGTDLGVLFEEKPGMFSSDLFSLPPTDLVLCCYFQSWKYFDGYQSDIRKMFHFKGKIRRLARTTISKAKHVYLTHLTDQVAEFGDTQTLTYIGVHVRRGDLQLDHHLRRGYKPAPLTYFHKAMDYYRQHYSNTIFLVTSDDIEWCKVKLGSSDVFFVEGQHEAVDLAVLSMTNHTVISVGTFSWWAGWLAGGQVIYYRDWPTKNSEVAQQYQHSDYFLPKWKPMSD